MEDPWACSKGIFCTWLYSLIADHKNEVRFLDIPGWRYNQIEKYTTIGVEFDDGSE